jgi:hypothetical protein
VVKGRRSNHAGISPCRHFGWPSGEYLGQIILSSLSSGLIDCSKNIFQPGLLGIKTDGEKVFLSVIGYSHDAYEGADGGAHGVRAAASYIPASLHHARHPEIYAFAIQGSPPSILSTRRSALANPVGFFCWGNYFNFTKFFLSAHHCRVVPHGGLRRRLVRMPGHPCQMERND